MNPFVKNPEKMDGQLRDRSVFVLPADALGTNSTSLFDLYIGAGHHCLQTVFKKRASAQLILTNSHSEPVIAFTGRTPHEGVPHHQIENMDDLNVVTIPGWNPVSAFFNTHTDKQMDSYLLYDQKPKAPIRPLPRTNRPVKSPPPTMLDELIEGIGRSPYDHLIVLTIRPKVIAENNEEKSEANDILDRLINKGLYWYKNKNDEYLDLRDRAYHVQPVEIIAYPEGESQPSEPIIDELTDLSTSDHEYKYEKVRTSLAQDKIAYTSTDIKEHLAERLFYRTDGKKRALDLLEKDMDNVLQRRKNPDIDVSSY